MPHLHCYLQQWDTVWLNLISDALIALAYLTIPITLIYFIRRRRDIPFHWMFICFGIFIVACGTTHAMEIYTLWHPAYRLAGVIKAVTAVASLMTAALLVRLMPQMLALPSPSALRESNEQLRLEIAERQRVENELRKSQDELSARVHERTSAVVDRERRLKLITDNVPALIAYVDTDQCYRFANKTYGDWFDTDPKTIVGRTIRELAGDERYAQIRDSVDRALSGKPVTFEHQIGNNASARIVRVNYTPHFDEQNHLHGFYVLGNDITERKRAEDTIRQSLREKEILLNEIHHRVKNNLQVVCSLLSLQSSVTHDESTRELFDESARRVKSMALVHETLHQSKDVSQISFEDYVRKLCENLFHSFGVSPQTIRIHFNFTNATLNLDLAVPCALIVNELISNVLKHAFPRGQKGELNLSLRSEADGIYELIVHDNGIGIPKDIDWRNTTSLGMQLVNNLTRQIGGTITLDSDSGTKFTVRFASRR